MSPSVVSFQKDLKVSWIDPELKSFMSPTPFFFRERESFIRPFYGWRKLTHGVWRQPRSARGPASTPGLFPLGPLVTLHLGAAWGSPLAKTEDKFPNTGGLGLAFWSELFKPPTCGSRSKQDQPTYSINFHLSTCRAGVSRALWEI